MPETPAVPVPATPTVSARRRGERGAATIEYVGATLLAVLLVTGLLLTPAGEGISNAFHRAVCSVIERDNCEVGTADPSLTPYEQALNGRYVGMGDSYASGEGAWDYDEGTDFDDRDDFWPFNDDEEAHNRCHRSGNAYARILERDHDFADGASFVACSGAVTGDLGKPNGSNTDEDPQLDALDDDVSLVTLSMSGNDLGFGDVVKDCIVNGARGSGLMDTCQQKHDQRIEELLPELQERLVAHYEKIKEKAPNARVIIVGYPQLFIDNPKDSYNNLLFAEDQVWMNEKGADLNAMLRAAAREAGVEFIDPTETFRNHGIGSKDPWINDLDLGGPGMMIADPSSFHPNAAGHAALAELVQTQMKNPVHP